MSPRVEKSHAFVAIDAWRGIAALMVVFYHTIFFAKHGAFAGFADNLLGQHARFFAYGVQIFFVLSGFCIAQAAMRKVARPNGARSFIFARIRRIYPPYLAAFLIAIALSAALFYGHSFGMLPSTSIGESLLFAQSPGYYACSLLLSHRLCGIEPALAVFWTLNYEMAFYVIAAIAIVLSGKRLGFLVLLQAITVMAALASAAMPSHDVFPFDHFVEFGLGVSVFALLNGEDRRFSIVSTSIIVVATMVAIWRDQAALIDPLHAYRPEGYAVSIAFSAIFLVSLLYDDHLKRSPVVLALGGIGVFSYSLYLIHSIPVQAIILIAGKAGIDLQFYPLVILVEIAASLLLAFVFFKLVEQPFLSKRQVVRADQIAHPVGAEI